MIAYLYNGDLYFTENTNEHIEVIKENIGERKIIKIKALENIELVEATEEYDFDFSKNDLFFLNGYQSWTDTKEFKYDERLKNVKKIPKLLNNIFKFTSYGDSTFIDTEKNAFHAYDIAYIKNKLFIGSYNYKNAYLIIKFYKKRNYILLISDIGRKALSKCNEFVIFDYIYSNKQIEGLNNYYNSLHPITNNKYFGYTSWYNHYQNINEEIIYKALDSADLRFELFQIDDGYEEYVGDWMKIDKNKFPNGLSNIIAKIHNKNMKAGIWISPLICETNSTIFKEHNDWIAKDENNKYIYAGGNWSKFYPLDLNNEEVIKYIKECLEFHKNLGFDFFKLDFLYACALKPLKGKTNAETVEYAYSLIKDVLGDKLILGCGASVSNAYERFDFLRIGPDVSLIFDDVFYMKYMHRERISTKVTIQNTIFRSPMNNHAFLNDPDVFLLRDNNMNMSFEQRKALLKINALFGSLLMTSDNPALDYDAEKKMILDDALNLFRNAKVLSYERIDNNISINYELNNNKYNIVYDTLKGVLING